MPGTTITPTRLFGPTQLGTTSTTTLYTAPTGSVVTINRLVVNNIATTSGAVSIWVVPHGNVSGAQNLIIGASGSGQSMAAGPSEPYVANALASMVLGAGDMIVAQASTAGSINIVASGWVQ